MVERVIVILFVTFFFSAPFAVEAGRSAGDAAQAERFEKYYGLFPDAEVQKRIDRIGQRLIMENGLKHGDFSFGVVNSGEINAVTLPGGYIYVFKGLMDFMPTDEELAAVIGHEMGHVMGNHIARREREQILTILLAALLGSPEAGIATNAALAALPAYGQRDEREADDSGFKYINGAKMNPYAMMVVMYKLDDADELKIEGSFSQHPQPAVRAERIKKYLQKFAGLPSVTEEGYNVIVRDGEWSFVVSAPDGANRPLYRAWLLAGGLYAIAQAGPLSPDKFIVTEEKEHADIYYDEQLVFVVSRADILTQGETLSGKAAEYVEAFRLWAVKRAQKDNGQNYSEVA